MNNTKYCKNCNETFTPRRRNHMYCNNSCKTMASYKRNNYKYITGHYQKTENNNQLSLPAPTKHQLNESITSLEERVQKMNKVNVTSVTNSALGSIAATTAVNGAKLLFAPNSLPATKGDVAALKNELNELKMMLKNYKINKFPF